MPFVKGQSGNPKGRKPGVPNKATMAWKELAADAIADPLAQANLRTKVQEDAHLMLKVAEHAHGKPTQEVRASVAVEWIVLPEGDDVAAD